MIGGNITATIQVKSAGRKNEIGEVMTSYSDIGSVIGWLDFASGQNDVSEYHAKIQDTTHYFICDFTAWVTATQDVKVTPENTRMVIDGNAYQILLIDDPMNLHQHLEVFLQYVGGGLGVS